MRRARFWGILLVSGAAVAVVVALTAAARGQARSTGQGAQAPRNFVWATGPDAQVFGAGGPQIGVTIRDGEKGEGVIIDDVRSESPASKAGVKTGDIVSEFDGERVRSARQLTRLVQETPSGRAVKMAVMRDGKRVELTVTPEAGTAAVWNDQFRGDMEKLQQDLRNNLRDLPREGGQSGGNLYWFRTPAPGGGELLPPEGWTGPFEGLIQSGARLGVTAQDLTQQLAIYFGAKEGVLVTSVTDGSAAAKAGLKAGDVVTAVNEHAVKTPSDLSRIVREAGAGADLTIAIVRDRKPMTLKAHLEKPAPLARPTRRAIIV